MSLVSVKLEYIMVGGLISIYLYKNEHVVSKTKPVLSAFC